MLEVQAVPVAPVTPHMIVLAQAAVVVEAVVAAAVIPVRVVAIAVAGVVMAVVVLPATVAVVYTDRAIRGALLVEQEGAPAGPLLTGAKAVVAVAEEAGAMLEAAVVVVMREAQQILQHSTFKQ